jgi:DNA/RNA endonuclease YhcR with UshA esterase domain
MSSITRFLRSRLLLMMLQLCPAIAYAGCIPFSEAGKHVGETRCVTGKVVRVKQGTKGVHFLDFCEDYRACSFTVVIFARDLKNVGDVRQLEGKTIEIHGPVKQYDGRAEIILRQARQLTGEAAQIPPLPKNYDVAKKGRYSAGKFSYPSAPRKPARKPQTPPVQTEEQSDPADSPE